MNPRGDYALELSTPVRHVATMIGGAAPAALSIKEMAATYKGLSGGDIHRIKVNEKLGSDAEAVEWLLEYAVEHIMRRGKKGMGADQLVRENGGYRLADGVDAETLEYDGRLIGRDRNIHTLGFNKTGDPFNPLSESGIFAENIRAPKQKDDLKDLCESIESLGYIKDLGIVKDERGVVLSGHRRLAAMEQLGIDPSPYVTTKRFGDGDAADIERLKYAIGMNTEQKPFTPKDRKRIAEYLYGTGEWTMTKIGELLKAATYTISKDLDGIPRVPTPSKDDGGHVPKGSLETLRPAILAETDAGTSQIKTAKKFGVSQPTVARFIKERKLGIFSCADKHENTPSSSKVPEDQQQVFFRLIDEGNTQTAAFTGATGNQPSNTGKIPNAWRHIYSEYIGRQKALAEIAKQQQPDSQSAPQPHCTQDEPVLCPHCGHTFTPGAS